MGRVTSIVLTLVAVLAGLLAINTIVLDNETEDAEVTVPDGEVIELAGADLQAVDLPATGSGPEREPIVLLHCFGCSGRWWEPITPLLNESHRVITIDLIGHGGSEKPSSGYEITAQSAAVAEALNQLGVTRATVVGHSLGGLVATSLAEQASQLVDRVVLIGTGSEAGDAELGFMAKLSQTPVVGEALWRVRTDGLVKSGYGEAFAPDFDVEGGFEDPDQVVVDNEAMTYTSFDQARAEADEFLEAGTTASRLTATGVPVLVIDGSEDQILDAAKVLADYEVVPGARSEGLDGLGHSPNVEDPAAVAELILPFAAAGGTLGTEPPPKPTKAPKPTNAKGPGSPPGPGSTPEGRPGGAGEPSPSEPRPGAREQG